MSGFRLTLAAEADLSAILRQTLVQFGTHQLRAYAELMRQAMAMVADDPERPGIRCRCELGPDVRSFHVDLASAGQGRAAHILYFARSGGEVVVLRVLHERMDPVRHLGGE